MKIIDSKECNTAKGVSIAIEFNKFKDVLFNKKIIRRKMKRIPCKKHKLGTYKSDKISLPCFDDKRYVLDDGIHTLAYFHKDSVTSCKKIKKDCEKTSCQQNRMNSVVMQMRPSRQFQACSFVFFTRKFYTHKKHKKHKKLSLHIYNIYNNDKVLKFHKSNSVLFLE